jgi:predicted transposase YdaD
MPLVDEPPLHDFPDRAIRKLLEDPHNLRDLLAAVVPDLVDRLDFEQRELVPNTFLLDDWRERESDLLFRLPFRAGGDNPAVLVCLLIEHQSEAHPWMPLRVLVYAALYWEREWKAWESERPRSEGFRLTPILPIVFHTGATPWRAPRVMADLIGSPEELRPFAPHWAPLFWDLAEQDPRALLASAGEWLAALAVVRAEGEKEAQEFRAVFAAVLQRLEGLSDTDPVRWHDLLWFVLSWGLRRRPGREREQLLEAARTSQADVSHRLEVERMSETVDMSWNDEVFARGEARGEARGVALGEARGEARGRVNAYRESLRVGLEERFGPLPEAVAERLEALDDPERLRGLIRQAYRITDLAELDL